MDDVRADLLRHHRQPALLPGEPLRAVRRARPARATIDGAGRQPAVPVLVAQLAGHGQVHPGAGQGADQPVNVAAERASVSRHVSRVDKYPKCHSARAPFDGPLAEAYASVGEPKKHDQLTVIPAASRAQ